MTEKENKSHADASMNCNVEEQQFTGLGSRVDLWKRLKRSLSARIKFVDSHISKGIAFQIQAMRSKKKWTQQQLADALGTNQNAVYRLENPNYGKQTITTLKKVAAIFDAALIVRFVPFSQLVDWVAGIPHIDRGLSEDALAVPGFDDDFGKSEEVALEARGNILPAGDQAQQNAPQETEFVPGADLIPVRSQHVRTSGLGPMEVRPN